MVFISRSIAVLAIGCLLCVLSPAVSIAVETGRDDFALNVEASRILALRGGLKSASLSLDLIEEGGGEFLASALPVPAFLAPSINAETPTWLANASFQSPYFDKPMIAVVIDDMGLNQKLSARVAALPAPLTLSYLPYAEGLTAQTANARQHGHELMLHMPMEPHGREQPGPAALLTGLSPSEIQKRVRHNFSELTGIVGINNHMGSKFTERGDLIDIVMKEVKQRNMLFLDSKTSGRSVAEQHAVKFDIPATHRDFFLDHKPTLDFVKATLVQAEKHARNYGSSVVIGHPKEITIEGLKQWLPYARERGFEIVPISKIVLYRNPSLQQKAAIAMASND